MQAPVYNITGEVIDNIEISDYVFGEPFNEALVHQAVVRQRANARQGTASTKTRSEVAGSTRKLFRQKGTGWARAGSAMSPIRRGGGVAFGPKPRDYHKDMPKKMRRLALRCALSAKVKGEEFTIVEPLKFDEPKTKEMDRILAALKIDSTALIVTSEAKTDVVKSARNIPGVKTIPADLLNVVDILSYKMILIEVDAVKKAEQIWGQKLPKEGNDGSLRGTEASVSN